MIADGAYQETVRAWEGDLAEQSTAPTDTHPCLADRLARLGGVAPADRDQAGPPAISLVPARAERPWRAVLSETLGWNNRLTSASWDECLRRIGQRTGPAGSEPPGTLVIGPSAASRDVLGPWPEVEEVWRALEGLIAEGKFRPTVYTDVEYAGLESVGRALQALGARKTWGKVVIGIPEESKSRI